MKKPKVNDLPEKLKNLILESIPRLKKLKGGQAILKVIRPRDGFYHFSEDLREEKKPVLVFSTVPWELDTPGGALRLKPFEPVLLEPRPSRRAFFKWAVGAAAVAAGIIHIALGTNEVEADGLLKDFALCDTYQKKINILNKIYGSKSREARIIYIRLLLSPWAGPDYKLVKGALAGLEIAGDQYLYTLACYYVIYARPELELKKRAIQRLAKLKDPLIKDNLRLLRRIDPELYKECVKLLMN